jgi:hypothetical protein
VARLSNELRHTARQHAWRQPWWRLGALAAGLVALLAAGGLAWRASADRSRLTIDPVTQERAVRQIALDAAGDHRDCALHFRLSEPPISLEDASHRYGDVYRALASAITPGRDDAQQPFDVVESHSCVYKGRRVAHIVLRSRGKLVSVVVAERGPASVTTGNQAQTAGNGGVVSLRAVDGFTSAFFTTRHHIVFVVSALHEYENLAVAKAIAPSLSRTLAESPQS